MLENNRLAHYGWLSPVSPTELPEIITLFHYAYEYESVDVTSYLEVKAHLFRNAYSVVVSREVPGVGGVYNGGVHKFYKVPPLHFSPDQRVEMLTLIPDYREYLHEQMHTWTDTERTDVTTLLRTCAIDAIVADSFFRLR